MLREKTKVRNKIHIGGYSFDICNTIFLLLCCVVVILPFMRVLAVSLSSSRMIDRGMVGIWPREFNTKGYEIVFSKRIMEQIHRYARKDEP